ncbi:hypothetical protein ACFQLX_07825 [Streptomyces polyrhachis]|uniref:DUF4232 domain-containing protein n=1 Tax=Streptomyces polyrhachis TaxID=1282885 RepID=A0ABW2GF96_9ACTN
MTNPGLDENALRGLLQGAVGELEPSEGALDHLRYAVPARRARRRQVLVGAAALAVLAAVSVPALLTTGPLGADGGDKPAIAVSGLPTPAAGGNGSGDSGGHDDSQEPAGAEKVGNGHSPSGKPGHGSPDPAGSGGSSGDTQQVAAPPCEAGDIKKQDTEVDTPDAAGNVTGRFVMANNSATPCTVTGTGTTHTVAAGTHISTTEHTAGDEAAALDLLPTPSTAAESITLAAGETYVVAFAFVPSPEAAQTCPAGSGATPAPEPGKDSGTGAEEAGDTLSDVGTAPQLMTQGEVLQSTDSGTDGAVDGETPPPAEVTEVAITHTPETGGETATVTVEATCAGTVYYTPPLEG